MGRLKTSLWTLAAAAFLAVCPSCEKTLRPSEETPGGESLSISVSGERMTKGAADGDVIKSLRVWLVKNGTVDAFYSNDAVNGASTTVTFENVTRGDHTLYIVANYKGLDSYVKGSAIDSDFTGKTLGAGITDGNSPVYTEEDGMPLSAVKRITIAIGKNSVEAHLLRVAGRISFEIRNTTTKDFYIAKVGLEKQNPSDGYLFQQFDSNGNVVHAAAGTNVAFPEVPGDVVKVAAGTTGMVYDHYLFETTPEASAQQFSFNMSGALYPTDKEAKWERELYSFGNNQTSIASGKQYLIRSASSSTFYLGISDAGSLILKEFNDDKNFVSEGEGIKKFLWEISAAGTSGYRIRNVGTGQYLVVSSRGVMSLGTSGSAFSTTTSGTGLAFYTTSGGYKYYLDNDTNTPGIAATTNPPLTSSLWHLREAKESLPTNKEGFNFLEADAEVSGKSELTYIDRYGNPQPLKHICRNEHLKVAVNIFFHEATESFTFSVEPWSQKDSETTFD